MRNNWQALIFLPAFLYGEEMVLEHKHLAETWAFKLSIALPLFFGGVLALAILYGEGVMPVCFKSECVETFFKIYKFPLAIAGFCLPLVALVAALQRSKEAAVQIKYASKQLEEAQLNNRFGNYLKHREGFSDLINDHCDRGNALIARQVCCEASKVYHKLFPQSGFNNPAWVGSYDEIVMAGFDKQASRLLETVKKSREEFDIIECVDALHDLMKSLRVSYGNHKIAAYVKANGLSENLSVPSFFDDRFVLAACVSDVFEIYTLMSVYSNNPNRIEVGDAVVRSEFVGNILATVSEIKFTMPRSYSNIDERVK